MLIKGNNAKWYDIAVLVLCIVFALVGVVALFCSPLLKGFMAGAGDGFYISTACTVGFTLLSVAMLSLSAYCCTRLKKYRAGELLVWAFVFLFMLAMNLASPAVVDDLSQTPNHGISMASVAQIFATLEYMYTGWGGRLVAHFLSYFMGMLGDLVFDIFNTVVFCLYLKLMTSFFKLEKENFRPALILVVFAVIWFLHPLFGQVFFWRAGSCNYLWTTTIVLAFLKLALPAKRDLGKNAALKCIGVFALGIIGGWCNENVTIAVLFILVADYLIQAKIEKNRIGVFNMAALCGWIFGSLVLLLAPGNYVRLASQAGASSVEQIDNLLVRMLGQLAKFADNLILHMAPLLMICIVLCIMATAAANRNGKAGKAHMMRLVVMVFAFGISHFALIPSFGAAPRAYTFTVTLLYLMIAFCLQYIVDNSDGIVVASYTWYPVLAFVLVLSFVFEVSYAVQYDYANDLRLQDLLRQKEAGAEFICIDRVFTDRKYCPAFELEDIQDDPAHYVNVGYELYFGVPVVLWKH